MSLVYGVSAAGLPGHGNLYATRSQQKKSRQALARRGGLPKINADAQPVGRSYCSGGFASEPGFTERMKAMIRHRSSLVLMMPPNGGIGPTTTSCLTRW